ncbi:hypothetical protein GDO81_004295 [Engystomops pustulosus]|uniref:Uncharacterized protein n=1 Tax=Engystomops pustulosus TaxID=76066 RepID=A0AAV6ZRF4_ENGPU|nr:hypothetical protein GDO81_004295 [Engystomops pustulosus]
MGNCVLSEEWTRTCALSEERIGTHVLSEEWTKTYPPSPASSIQSPVDAFKIQRVMQRLFILFFICVLKMQNN